MQSCHQPHADRSGRTRPPDGRFPLAGHADSLPLSRARPFRNGGKPQTVAGQPPKQKRDRPLEKLTHHRTPAKVPHGIPWRRPFRITTHSARLKKLHTGKMNAVFEEGGNGARPADRRRSNAVRRHASWKRKMQSQVSRRLPFQEQYHASRRHINRQRLPLCRKGRLAVIGLAADRLDDLVGNREHERAAVHRS